MAEIRLAGFGLDALPHAASAYTLSGLLYDAVDAARGPTDALGADSPPAGWSSHAVATTGGLLALLTAIYESGEYVIHRYELAKAGGDPDGINMLWSLDDTVHDVVSNAVGWLAATLRR
jgi:hypothetical protein